MKFPYRYIARITVEAITPLIIGSDTLLYDQDSPVDKDFNNLPYIPGTAIAGFFRSSITDEKFYGSKKNVVEKQPEGSNIIVSDAYLLDSNQEVAQEPKLFSEIKEDEILRHYENLPLRQHTKINHLGASESGSKFDQEFVYKGSRFKFDISFETEIEESEFWEKIINQLQQKDIYIGSGKYNNFGELKIIKQQIKTFNLKDESDLEAYLETSVDLNSKLADEIKFKIDEKKQNSIVISLDGSNSFFHFGSGLGDAEVDDTNYQEQVVKWDDNDKIIDTYYVIPGTSIKGALAHRTAYYYNKENEVTIESLLNIKTLTENQEKKFSDILDGDLPDDIETLEKLLKKTERNLLALDKSNLNIEEIYQKHLGENNTAVATLFGTAKNTKKNITGQRGKLIIKDIYLSKNKVDEKVFMHNKIDRFTQSTIDNALFGEKAFIITKPIELVIKGDKESLENPYFNMALDDLKNGLLPLGGKTSRGHGIFTKVTEKEK